MLASVKEISDFDTARTIGASFLLLFVFLISPVHRHHPVLHRHDLILCIIMLVDIFHGVSAVVSIFFLEVFPSLAIHHILRLIFQSLPFVVLAVTGGVTSTNAAG